MDLRRVLHPVPGKWPHRLCVGCLRDLGAPVVAQAWSWEATLRTLRTAIVWTAEDWPGGDLDAAAIDRVLNDALHALRREAVAARGSRS